jgi:hypothetical protein
MPLIFDYGTDAEQIDVDEQEVDKNLRAMDTTELGVIIGPEDAMVELLAFRQRPRPT